jgi:uncharacterized damage-inducible protein DinB
MIDYRIKPKDNFDERVGELVTMLEHSREVTLNEVTNLNQNELDYLLNDNSNSIGSLLLHIASIEFVHQVITFENRDLNENEVTEWQTALELGEKARNSIKNQPIEFYLEKLFVVRMNTINQLKLKRDSWLYEENKWDNGVPYNNYYLWFHVMEDEISHRGQIRMIKRLLKDF